MRFKLLGRAGLLATPAGKKILDLGPDTAFADQINRTLQYLRAA